MEYFSVIKTAILIFPFIVLVSYIPFIIYQYHKYGSVNLFRVLIIYSFILYLITIYFLVILPLPNKSVYHSDFIRLVPFNFIKDIVKDSPFVLSDFHTYIDVLLSPSVYTVILNIIMFIPLGMYLRYYFKCSLKKALFISLVLSLFFEFTQASGLYYIYPYPYRVFDVDDLIMNTIGGIIGYFIMGFINVLPTREKLDEDSFKRGEVVSGFRRITIFILDLFLYSFITFVLSVFIKNRYLLFIVFIFYYIIYPYFKMGRTFGSEFLGVRLSFGRFRVIKLIFRIVFLYSYYIGSIFVVLCFVSFICNVLVLDAFEVMLLFLLVMMGMMLFYLINFFMLIKNGSIYYDDFFKVEYVNTIEKEE